MLKQTTTYQPGSEIKKYYNVSSSTLRYWANNEKVATIRTPGGKRLYSSVDITRLLEPAKEKKERREGYCYARVSSSHQKEDLDRQVQYLQSKYPDYKIIKDIGSGLNWYRVGFRTLLDAIYEGIVGEVVVTHKDRLCRFGLDLVQWIFKKHNVQLLVLNQIEDHNKHREQELADDLLAIVNFFVAKNNGRRAAENRKRRKGQEEEGKEAEGRGKKRRGNEAVQSEEDKTLSN
jgi:predicted site-specific integrase-resolvase